MSRVRADNYTDYAGTGSPTFPYGAVVTGVITATSFSGDGSNLTGIDSTALVDSGGTTRVQANASGINITGVVTATTFSGNLPTTNLTGTITNAQLAGSIDNSKLSNSTVSYGGVQLSLGGSDATPAFDLSNSTNYPYTSLTGITTDIVGDTTPQLGGNLDLNNNDISGTGNVNLTGIVTATGGFNIGIQSAGVNVTTGVITALNFIGAGNTFAINGSTVDVSIAGGGGGGGGSSYDITEVADTADIANTAGSEWLAPVWTAPVGHRQKTNKFVCIWFDGKASGSDTFVYINGCVITIDSSNGQITVGTVQRERYTSHTTTGDEARKASFASYTYGSFYWENGGFLSVSFASGYANAQGGGTITYKVNTSTNTVSFANKSPGYVRSSDRWFYPYTNRYFARKSTGTTYGVYFKTRYYHSSYGGNGSTTWDFRVMKFGVDQNGDYSETQYEDITTEVATYSSNTSLQYSTLMAANWDSDTAIPGSTVTTAIATYTGASIAVYNSKHNGTTYNAGANLWICDADGNVSKKTDYNWNTAYYYTPDGYSNYDNSNRLIYQNNQTGYAYHLNSGSGGNAYTVFTDYNTYSQTDTTPTGASSWQDVSTFFSLNPTKNYTVGAGTSYVSQVYDPAAYGDSIFTYASGYMFAKKNNADLSVAGVIKESPDLLQQYNNWTGTDEDSGSYSSARSTWVWSSSSATYPTHRLSIFRIGNGSTDIRVATVVAPFTS